MTKKLTKNQWAELLKLNEKKQSTYGKGRARTQNTLVVMGLAMIADDGLVCLITQAGRDAVAVHEGKAAPKRTTFKVTFEVEVTLTLSEDMLSAVLTDEWRRQYYKLINSQDVAEHLAYNFALNRVESLKRLDGFADRHDEDAILVAENWDSIDSIICTRQ